MISARTARIDDNLGRGTDGSKSTSLQRGGLVRTASTCVMPIAPALTACTADGLLGVGLHYHLVAAVLDTGVAHRTP